MSIKGDNGIYDDAYRYLVTYTLENQVIEVLWIVLSICIQTQNNSQLAWCKTKSEQY